MTAAEAKNHVGENPTVCGKVVSARFAKDSKGQPTFLNLDEPYPRQIFTIVVWGSNRETLETSRPNTKSRTYPRRGRLQFLRECRKSK